MIEMVVGFLFDNLSENVLLIKKNRPAWQKGRLNGVGGKIEKDETPLNAMIREFTEETDQEVSRFKNYAIMNGSGWRVYFFSAVTDTLELKENPTDEEQVIVKVKDLPRNTIDNLRWLIPMATDKELLKPSIIYYKTVDGREIWIDE